MAMVSDAEVVLKLYELRQEEILRAARKFIAIEFQPKTVEELRVISRNFGTEQNAYWRQVLSYWEMAASLALRGAVDADLYLDSNGEGIYIYAKYHHFHVETEKESGNTFMKHTAALIERFPKAKAHHDAMLKALGLA